MSCCHSALSNGIEAFISRMIADGPPWNRPPHMVLEPLLLLSRSLKLAILGFAAVAPLLLGGCDRQSGGKAQPAAAQSADLAKVMDRSHKGSALPEFTLNDPADKPLLLSSLKGKPLLINLWATWCGPCVLEMPMLEKLAAAKAGELKVLTVSQDLEAAPVARFFTEHGLHSVEPWLDPQGSLAAHYGATTLPTTIYYDANGREVWRLIGGHDWSNAETGKMLAERN